MGRGCDSFLASLQRLLSTVIHSFIRHEAKEITYSPAGLDHNVASQRVCDLIRYQTPKGLQIIHMLSCSLLFHWESNSMLANNGESINLKIFWKWNSGINNIRFFFYCSYVVCRGIIDKLQTCFSCIGGPSDSDRMTSVFHLESLETLCSIARYYSFK